VITPLREKVLTGGALTRREALALAGTPLPHLPDLFAAAHRLRTVFRGTTTELCAIINAKSGACPEDCAYCAQSVKSKAEIPVYPLLRSEFVMEKALEAQAAGVRRFSVVTSGRRVSRAEVRRIAPIIEGLSTLGLLPCASLGLIDGHALSYLRDYGLQRYHHNIETSERFFPLVCRTHTYRDRVKTIEAALSAGLSVCSGGIFGMGETWEDRIEMAFALKDMGVHSVPVNFLIPIKGTGLGDREMLPPLEALTVISLLRFMLPDSEIRICGGRIQVMGELHPVVLSTGADSLMTGNYLTTSGRTYADDIRLEGLWGLDVAH
jgi:biotin synthase